MNEIPYIIDSLEKAPLILGNLIKQIPEDLFKLHRIPGKWSIHEHACHLSQTDAMIKFRFETFKKEEKPVFKPYLPGTNVSDDNLIHLNLQDSINVFSEIRLKMVSLLKSFEEDLWSKTAIHPEFSEYSPYILLRHAMMHDHFHMYRIEELWLTKDEFLRKA